MKGIIVLKGSESDRIMNEYGLNKRVRSSSLVRTKDNEDKDNE